AGGAIVTWYDFRAGTSFDIYAQHVLLSGAVDPSWPTDGLAVSTATNDQAAPTIVSDGANGAIITWHDLRSAASYDIYTQRVARYGFLGTPEAEITAVKDVPNDNGGKVKLSWNASYLEADPYDIVYYYNIFRSVPPNAAAAAVRGGARARGVDEPESPRP